VLDGPNTDPLVIFRQGAGHIQPNGAADPGLVYNSNYNDWLAFLCGATSGVNTAYCRALAGAGYSLVPSDLTGASIAIGSLSGSQTIRRRVTNVGEKERYSFSYSGLAGITVVPSVSSFSLEENRSRNFAVTFTNSSALPNAYVGGSMTWTGNRGHVVSIPVVIRPVALAAPAQVSGSGDALNYKVTFGYTGSFTAVAMGLVPATPFTGSVSTDPDGSFAPEGGSEAVSFSVVVPAGTTYARFALFDANVSPGSDVDLYVYRGATLVGSSFGSTSAEEVNLLNPAAGTYTVWVHGYATASPSSAFTLFTWALGSTAAGNMTVGAPASATLGTTGAINLSFPGLAGGTKYLGSVAYSGVAGMPDPTIVRIDK
jgi:hypothetical protein